MAAAGMHGMVASELPYSAGCEPHKKEKKQLVMVMVMDFAKAPD
jgi:hypothetical protein